MKISILLISLLLLISINNVSAANEWIIEGNSVYVNDENVYLSATPHTLYSSGYVYFNLSTKSYTGDVDVVWGFNISSVKPVKGELYNSITESWVDKSSAFNTIEYEFEGMDKWYYVKNIPVVAETNYSFRTYLDVPISTFGSNGKYWFAVKPSSETIQQAINNGHFYYLDPWWNATWKYRKTIEINNTGDVLTYYQYNITIDTATLTTEGKLNANGSDFRITNESNIPQPFWNETPFNSSSTEIWINATLLSNVSNTTHYMYYGNPSALSISNGNTTFMQWHGAATANFHDSNIITVPFIYECKGRNLGAGEQSFGVSSTQASNGGDAVYIHPNVGDNKVYGFTRDNTIHGLNSSAPVWTANVYYEPIIVVKSSSDAKYYTYGTTSYVKVTINVPDEAMGLFMYEPSGASEQKWSFIRQYAATLPTVSLGPEKTMVEIIVVHQTPSILYTNSTGNFSIEIVVYHNTTGLNLSQLAIVWTICDCNATESEKQIHNIRYPSNSLADAWGSYGYILRGDNRNRTLWFDDNVSIVGTGKYNYSGCDINCTRVNVVNISDTETRIYFNGTIEDTVNMASWYLCRNCQIESPKTEYAINKFSSLLFKGFDLDKAKTHIGATSGHIVRIYMDSHIGGTTPAEAFPIYLALANESFNPAGAVNILDSPYTTILGSANATQWSYHSYSPHPNATYFVIDINTSALNATHTPESYLYLYSNTPAPKSYHINVSNGAVTGSNISFAQTGTAWTGTTAPYTPYAYTVNSFYAVTHSNLQFRMQASVMTNDSEWLESGWHTSDIERGDHPPTTPRINHFVYNGVEYNASEISDKSFDELFYIWVEVGDDPDGGIVTHNLTLHKGTGEFVAIINNTFTNEDVIDGHHVNISFDPSSYSEYYSYTMKIVATDNENDSAYSWLGVDFYLLLPLELVLVKMPLSIFIMWSAIMVIGLIASFITVGPVGLFSSFMTMSIAFMNSLFLLNGRVVQYYSGITSADKILIDYTIIESPELSLLYLTIAIVSGILFAVHVYNEFKYQANNNNYNENEDEV